MCTSISSYSVDTDRACFNVKTEADADCMIPEFPHDDKSAVGMLFHSFICLCCFVICLSTVLLCHTFATLSLFVCHVSYVLRLNGMSYEKA